MSMIIKDYTAPKLTDRTHDSYKILTGYVNDKPFEFWYVADTIKAALRQADIAWEAHKKTLYGPTTHVETVRNAQAPVVDKYRSPE